MKNDLIATWVIRSALLASVSCTTVPSSTETASSTSGNASTTGGMTTTTSSSTSSSGNASTTTGGGGMGGMGGMMATSGSTSDASSSNASSTDSSSASTTAASTTAASSSSSGMTPECMNSTDCASGMICSALLTCEPAVLVGNIATQTPGAGTTYQLVDASLGTGFACGANFCLSGGIVR